MQADFEGAEEYLKNRNKKYFFENSMNNPVIDDDFIFKLKELIKKYKKNDVKQLFYPMLDTCSQGRYVYEQSCKNKDCKQTVVRTFSKTSFFEFIELENFIECKDCQEITKHKYKILEEKQQEERKNWELKQFYDFCKIYLNPEMEWNKGVKNYEKMQQISSIRNISLLKQYIKNMPYEDFLKTPYWRAVSEKKRRQSNFKCQMCNDETFLQVHHRSYENHGLEHLHLEDLIVLCKKCHEKFHDVDLNHLKID